MNCKYEYYLGFEKIKEQDNICSLEVAEGLRTVRPVLPHREVNNEPLNNFKRSVDNHNDKRLILLDKYLNCFFISSYSSA